jgi:hypothetical protein
MSTTSITYEQLLESDPELKRRFELITKVGDESERGMAVLVAAELDRALELVLKAYLAPGKARDDLFAGGTPPLGTFSSKINLAQALQLIRQGEYESLQLIRRIRNEFAHNPDASFADAKIKSWMRGLPENHYGQKAAFELHSIGLVARLETDAVHEATERLSEESHNTFYRRGHDHAAESKPASPEIPS